MKYTTIKDLYYICENQELWNDFKVSNTKDCLRAILNKKQFFKAYLSDIRLDIKDCIANIRSDSFLANRKLIKELLSLKNDMSIHIKPIDL